jgi:hypothetical protein
VNYDFSLIDSQVGGEHDGRMRRLPIAEMMFIARCLGWRMRAARCADAADGR